MTEPQLQIQRVYRIEKSVSDWDGHEHLYVEIDGTRNAVPADLECEAGDLLCVAKYVEVDTK